MTQRRKKSILQIVLFTGYIFLMLWLLFGQRTHKETGIENINLKPFATLKLYLNILKNSTDAYLLRHAFINLVGNVIMFIPLGYFLPGFWKRTRHFFSVLFCTVVLIALIEMVQYISGLGSCDIDDLLLNVPGVLTGWLIRMFTAENNK